MADDKADDKEVSSTIAALLDGTYSGPPGFSMTRAEYRLVGQFLQHIINRQERERERR